MKSFTVDRVNFSIRMTTPINKTYPALDAEDVAKKMRNADGGNRFSVEH